MIEQEIIKEGVSREEMRRLCDVHLDIMKEGIEKEVVKELCEVNGAVIAVGGGTFMYDENLCLKENSKIALLVAPVEVLADRIGNDPNRPPLHENQSSTEEIGGVWRERKQRYYELADYVLDTKIYQNETAADMIIKHFNLQKDEQSK